RRAQAEARAVVNAQRAADRPEGERDLQLANERAVVAPPPRAQGLVATVARGEGVRARLDGAPVVARGDHDRVDAVHDALVVRRGAVGIALGELARADDASAH